MKLFRQGPFTFFFACIFGKLALRFYLWYPCIFQANAIFFPFCALHVCFMLSICPETLQWLFFHFCVICMFALCSRFVLKR